MSDAALTLNEIVRITLSHRAHLMRRELQEEIEVMTDHPSFQNDDLDGEELRQFGRMVAMRRLARGKHLSLGDMMALNV